LPGRALALVQPQFLTEHHLLRGVIMNEVSIQVGAAYFGAILIVTMLLQLTA
jgi:hypothetical protein